MRVLRVFAAIAVVAVCVQPCRAGLSSADQFRQVLTGVRELDRPTQIAARRLVFNDYTIITNGFPLEISADTLTVWGKTTIVAFAPRDILPGQAGRAAGPITINVRDMDGEVLVIRNDGERGGDGLRGAPGVRGAAGTPGKNAVTVFFGRCQPGTAGTPGGEGGPGGRGGDGAPGGRGGDVTVNVDNDRDKLDISARGGTGGAGGDGGPGGPGGPGGTGGQASGRCLASAAGEDGVPGRAGEPGARGSDGEAGTVRQGSYIASMGMKR